MPRGRPKKIRPEGYIDPHPIQEQPKKFVRTYENDNSTETWNFDLEKKTNGPIEVNIKYKGGADKKWVKDQNEQKRIKRDFKKINKL